MGLKVLVQFEKNDNFLGDVDLPSSSDVSAIEVVSQHNWLHPSKEDKIEIRKASLASIHTSIYDSEWLKGVIPLGSIEFIEAVLKKAYGIDGLMPEQVPDKVVSNFDYWGRKVRFNVPSDMLRGTWLYLDTDKLFIKSASKVKCDYTGLYSKKDKIPADTLYTISEPIDIKSEWRVFVLRGEVRDIRNYLGDTMVIPDINVIKSIIKDIGNDIPSYTLDVGVLSESNKTVIIELHNFISCGLYGAELPISMYSIAYRHELNKHLNKGYKIRRDIK